ncbi:DUF5711 family protein [Tissierella sp. Yu-01]|uniref:DUF5711 family protein n=1 Tax=Tissierella sp. Yu-01 TaxID=3035694 RepID=UPI00240E5B0C|nr:DUF5711 family protein [Tissierella sp. Yu-01]WFA08336.1 DUF5711 family protein [Tissierella sp. Yu-01]
MEETKKIHKGFKKFILIFAVFALILMNTQVREKLLELLDGFKRNDLELTLDIQYQGENLNYFQDTLIRWQNNTITYFNNDGSDKWVKKYDFDDPEIIFGHKVIYIMNKSTGDIYLMDNKGDTISRIQINKPIFNLKEFSDNIMVHVKEQDTLEYLYILDKSGNPITDLETNDNILTYGLGKDNTKFVYSTLMANDTELKSTLFLNKITGDEEYSLELPNEIILFSEFLNSEVVVLTNTRLLLVKNGEVSWSKEHNGFNDILIKGNEINLLYDNSLEVFDLSGEVKTKINLSIESNQIIDLGKYIGIHGNKDLAILQNHNEILKYIGEEDILKILGNNNYIAIHYLDKVDVFKLDNK